MLAVSVKMTQMPQLVGLLNSFGGLAAALEAIGLYVDEFAEFDLSEGLSRLHMALLLLSLVLGRPELRSAYVNSIQNHPCFDYKS